MRSLMSMRYANLGVMCAGWMCAQACTPNRGAADDHHVAASTEALHLPQEMVETATFAGGCFWCMEPPFEGLVGVYDVTSGYSGGPEVNPTYEQVSSGTTGHAESVQIQFSPAAISYRQLVDIYLRSMDPTDGGGQFADRGRQYRPAIFTHGPAQVETAKAALEAIRDKFQEPLAVEITPYRAFYPAEDYHQDYYRTHTAEYKRYRHGSGRTAFLQRTWGQDVPEVEARYVKPDAKVLASKLTPLQLDVTQREGTEPPFKNPLWNEHGEGVYVDRVSGEPLFSSTDKYDSGTGWPSFTRPLVPGSVVYKKDTKLGAPRIEVRSKHGGSHLGHVFADGPKPTGQRYCMNSAALRFVPRDKLKQEGLGHLLPLFQSTALRSARKSSRP